MKALTKSSPEAWSWLSTGSSWRRVSIVDVLGQLDHADADAAEVGERLQHPDQVVALGVDRVQRAGQLVEGGVDGARAGWFSDRDSRFERVERVDDVLLVLVELAG